MRKIFDETTEVALRCSTAVRETYRGHEVKYYDTPLYVSTVAHYDRDRRVLVVDVCGREGGGIPSVLQEDRVLETQPTESAAIRRAVEIADRWHGIIRGTWEQLPDERPEAEIIAAAVAAGTVLRRGLDDY